MKLLYAILFALILVSCGKDEECIDDVVGTYSGNCNSNIGTFQGTMTITSSSTGASNLVITDTVLDGGASPYTATLSGDCNTITVPSQAHITGSGLSATISGSYQLSGTSLTGNLNVIVGTGGTVCSYNMTKL